MSQAKSSKDWARELISYYEQGYSDAEVASAMKITIREYYKQIEDNPTFAKLVEFGRTLCMAWWESQARIHLKDKSFNTPLWVFNMKNKFGWADKVETRNEAVDSDVSLDELRQKLLKQTHEFVKRHAPELTESQLLSVERPDIYEEVINGIEPEGH